MSGLELGTIVSMGLDLMRVDKVDGEKVVLKKVGEVPQLIKTLRQVSFYSRINHGTKSKDYGEVVDPILRALGQPTGEL